MYETNLEGKLALVTGGSRGLGLHIAEALQVVGATVAITGRNETTLSEAAADLGESCRPYVCDQRDPRAVNEMAEAVIADLGHPDILVNNAATITFGKSIVDTTLQDWTDTIDTNLTGVFVTTQAFLPGMIEKGGGDIFMIGSTSGKKGDAGMGPYCASKFGLQGLAQSLLYEVRQNNIRVTVLNPSTINTGSDVGPTEGPGVHLHAADVAATIVHLCGLPRRTLVRDMDIWGTNP